MQKRNNYTSIATFFIVICVFVLILWKIGALNFFSGVVSKIFSGPREASISTVYQNNNLDLVKLSKNLDLIKLQKENQALRDQFATSEPGSKSLLPAKVIGAPGFVPGVTLPDYFILNRGEKDGVKKGQAIVIENNLIGEVSQTTAFSSKVVLVNSSSVSFTGKLASEAVGVVKGFGDRLEIQNILLSENIKKDDVVLTKGSQDINGIGFPPDLIVGKIISVDKNPSALFQIAEVKSLVDFSKINIVFVVIR